MPNPITVNSRTYHWMDRPLVVVCVDGCQYEYITAAGVPASRRSSASSRRVVVRR